MRDGLMQRLTERIPGLHVNGDGVRGLYNTLSVSFPGDTVHGHEMVELLDAEFGISLNSGSACSKGKPSEALTAMHPNNPSLVHNTVRISLSHLNTEAECEFAASSIVSAWRALLGRS
jgi:cysteine sulfinate desulfinase/cysteine desulfurase-like protein